MWKRERLGDEGTDEGGDAAGEVIVIDILGVRWWERSEGVFRRMWM